jgi:hypothetical protein
MSKDGAAQPVSFFRIKGIQNENSEFSFSTTKNSVFVEAAATTKGQHLAAEATALVELADTESFVVRHYEEGVARDFSFESAAEITCALFGCIANTPTTGIDAIDNVEERLWQLNLVRVEELPAGSNIRTNDGTRLWFLVTVRDCTGELTLYIQEAAALKLSGIADADQFETAHMDGKLWFPRMASVKVIRRLECSAWLPADFPERQLDLRIVDAAPQNLCEAPTEESARLFLNSDIISTDVVLPAALHMLRKSPLYTLAVESAVPVIPESLNPVLLACFQPPPFFGRAHRLCS